MIAVALRKRTLSPVRLVLKVTFFCCYLPKWCFFVFLGSINQTRLVSKHYSDPLLVYPMVLILIRVSLLILADTSCNERLQCAKISERFCEGLFQRLKANLQNLAVCDDCLRDSVLGSRLCFILMCGLSKENSARYFQIGTAREQETTQVYLIAAGIRLIKQKRVFGFTSTGLIKRSRKPEAQKKGEKKVRGNESSRAA